MKRPSTLSLSFNGVSIGTHCTARNFTIHRTTFSFRGLSSRKCFPSIYFANRNTVRSRTLLQNLDTVSFLFLFLYSLYIDFSLPAIFLLLSSFLSFLNSNQLIETISPRNLRIRVAQTTGSKKLRTSAPPRAETNPFFSHPAFDRP